MQNFGFPLLSWDIIWIWIYDTRSLIVALFIDFQSVSSCLILLMTQCICVLFDVISWFMNYFAEIHESIQSIDEIARIQPTNVTTKQNTKQTRRKRFQIVEQKRKRSKWRESLRWANERQWCWFVYICIFLLNKMHTNKCNEERKQFSRDENRKIF